MSMKECLTLYLAVLFIGLTANLSAQGWKLVKTLYAGDETPIYTACKSPNLIYFTTFNSPQIAGTASVIAIADPLVAAHRKVVDSHIFDGQRGYSGIAISHEGMLYVSADGGSPEKSFIKKITLEGKVDPNFGNDGLVKGTNHRFLGLDVVGDYLLVAVDWGNVQILSTRDGKMLNELRATEDIYICDIAVNPRSNEIYGIAAGSIYRWKGGSPVEPATYKFERLFYMPEGIKVERGFFTSIIIAG